MRQAEHMFREVVQPVLRSVCQGKWQWDKDHLSARELMDLAFLGRLLVLGRGWDGVLGFSREIESGECITIFTICLSISPYLSID